MRIHAVRNTNGIAHNLTTVRMVVRLVMMSGLGGSHRQIGKSRELTRVAQYEK